MIQISQPGNNLNVLTAQRDAVAIHQNHFERQNLVHDGKIRDATLGGSGEVWDINNVKNKIDELEQVQNNIGIEPFNGSLETYQTF